MQHTFVITLLTSTLLMLGGCAQKTQTNQTRTYAEGAALGASAGYMLGKDKKYAYLGAVAGMIAARGIVDMQERYVAQERALIEEIQAQMQEQAVLQKNNDTLNTNLNQLSSSLQEAISKQRLSQANKHMFAQGINAEIKNHQELYQQVKISETRLHQQQLSIARSNYKKEDRKNLLMNISKMEKQTNTIKHNIIQQQTQLQATKQLYSQR